MKRQLALKSRFQLSQTFGPSLRPLLSFFYQLISLTALCLFYFTQNRGALYLPYDGAYMQQVVKFHFEWSVPTTNLILNPLQGLGGMTFPLNYWFSPSHLLTFLLGGATPDAVLIYTLIALEFFVSMWFLAYVLGASRRVVASASWLGTLLVMPFVVPPFENKLTFYAISGLVPWIIEHIAFSNTCIALLILLRSAQSRLAIAYAMLALLVYIVSLMGFPFSAVLGIPLIAVFFFYALAARPFSFMGRSVSIGFVLGLIILASLPAVYIIALLLHTVPSFFNSELIYGRGKWVFISILFHNLYGLGWLSSVVFLAGIAGGLMAWRHGNGLLREVASIYVIYAVGIVVTGILFTFVFTWYRGPTFLYFEWFTWPFIFVYACFLGESLLRRYGHRLLTLRLKTFFSMGRVVPSIPFVLVAPVLIFAVLLAVNRPKEMKALPVPPRITPLVDTLIFHCGLTPGDAWRGSVATFTGVAQPGESNSWGGLASYDTALWQETGNDHRSVGLWWHGVPTLFAYNQYLNPEYYYLMTRLFATQSDQQQRSVLVLTQSDARLLGLFGVRYVISEKELPSGQPVKIIQRYTWDDLSPMRMKAGRQKPLLLYEIDRPNLGNFTPTKQLVEPTAVGALARIQDPEFRPERDVVLSRPIVGGLEESKDMAFIWEKGGISVRAQSRGQSLLVLPLQYSNCLKIESEAGTATKETPRLVRANLALTGVVFTGKLHAKIRYPFGPFSRPLCRVQDYLEARQMRLGMDARSVSNEK